MNPGYNVRNTSNVDNKCIKLGKTFKYGDNYHLTNIYYLDAINNGVGSSATGEMQLKEVETKRQDAVEEKTKLIIQTPLMYIPNSMIYFNDKPFLELSFNNEENDKDVSEFKTWLYSLEDYLFKLIKRRTTLNITKEQLTSIIKKGYNNTSTKLLVPINTNVSKCILSDEGSKRNKILFNWELPVPTYAISIIWVKNIWVKKGKWGINLFMYATRAMNSHILDPIDFLGCDSNNKNIRSFDIINKFQKDEKMNILVGQVPEYTTYFKMQKMGIPKDAIKQKMTLTGTDPRILDYPENTPYITVLHYISNPHLGNYIKNSSGMPPPAPPPPPPLPLPNMLFSGNGIPPPPPPPGFGISNSNNMRMNLLNEISTGGFTLKKVDPKDKLVNKLATQNPNGLKVPSLNDIQNALARLKKIDIDG